MMQELQFPRDHYETQPCAVCGKNMIACWVYDKALPDNSRIWHWWCGSCGNTEGEYFVKPDIDKMSKQDLDRFKRLNPPTRYEFNVNNGNVITSSGKRLPPADELNVILTRDEAETVIESLRNSLDRSRLLTVYLVLTGNLIHRDESDRSYAVAD